MGWFSKLPHFKVTNILLRDTNGKGKFKRLLSFLFSRTKESFWVWNLPSNNSTLFSWRRSAWPVLKCYKGSDVFEDFSGTFCLLHRRFIDIVIGTKKNYKMCRDLRWSLCWILPCAQPILVPFKDWLFNFWIKFFKK